MTKGLIAGCFDLLHPGYIRLLAAAKEKCDYLVIALQDDPSIDRPKTKKKPIFTVEERQEILLAIRFVDKVRTYQTEEELAQIIVEERPDLRFLGSDYLRPDQHITGKGLAPIAYIMRNHKWSMTRLIKLICERGV